MNKANSSRQSRLMRKLILTTTIAPAFLGFAANAAPITWSGGPQSVTNNDTFAGGLHEGLLAGGFNETAPNPNQAITLNARAAETNAFPPWADNTTWIYTGEVSAGPNGTLSFAENIDDNVLLKIDGVQVLRDTNWNTVVSTGVLTFTPGSYHSFELRVANGGGGAGPVAQNGFANDYGFGLSYTGATSTNGADYQNPTDPGDGTVFRYVTAAAGGDDVTVTGNTVATVNNGTSIGKVVTENSFTFNPAGASVDLTVNKSGDNSLRSLSTTIAANKTANISGAAAYAAVVPLFAQKLLAGVAPTIYGDGRQTRDFTYIDNVVQANLLAASVPAAAGQTFNVGSGQAMKARVEFR